MVRTPNWLGDLVMSYAFFEQLTKAFPNAHIDVIVKKGLQDLLFFFPVQEQFVFSKKDYKGPIGLRRFVKKTALNNKEYDLFFSLPDSFSAALMGQFVNAKHKIGYANEGRSIFLTHAYALPKNTDQNIDQVEPTIKRHRVFKYVHLLEQYLDKTIDGISTQFKIIPWTKNEFANDKKSTIVLNLKSVAESRSLSLMKSLALLEALQKTFENIYTNSERLPQFVIIGTKDMSEFTQTLIQTFDQSQNVNTSKPGQKPEQIIDIIDMTGKTNLLELSQIIHSAKMTISVDSGPAHLANSLGCPTLVLFGAGNAHETRPFVEKDLIVLKKNGLDCAPCQSNKCHLKTLECLEALPIEDITNATKTLYK